MDDFRTVLMDRLAKRNPDVPLTSLAVKIDEGMSLQPGLVDDPEDYDLACWMLESEGKLTVDIETTGLKLHRGDRICGIAVMGDYAGPFYFPFRHEVGINLPLDFMARLYPILSKVPIVGFNYATFDDIGLGLDGFPSPSVVEDVMLAAHIHNENEYRFSKDGVVLTIDGKPRTDFRLKSLAVRKLGDRWATREERLLTILRARFPKTAEKDLKGQMWTLPPKQVAPYACDDVRMTKALLDYYGPRLDRDKLRPLWYEFNTYSQICGAMTKRGVLCDHERLEEFDTEAVKQVADLQFRLSMSVSGGKTDLIGQPLMEFNPNSTPQVRSLLRILKADKETMEALQKSMSEDDPRQEQVAMILACRGYSKAHGSFYSSYRGLMDKDHVIHPSFNLAGTVAGRPSCYNPNLQGVARLTDYNKAKLLFIARPGFSLVSGDYSQAEVRWASHYGQEATMAKLLIDGDDIHAATARDVTNDNRQDGKRVNFSSIYGIGPKTLGERLAVSINVASGYLSRFHRTYPGFMRLYRRAEATAKTRGFIKMFTGRRRRYDGDLAPARKASSNLIQGCVAEMMRVAIMKLDVWIKENYPQDVFMLLQVHDQVLFEVRQPLVRAVVPELRRIMETIVEIGDIPLPVDFGVGKSWGELKDWE